MARRLQPTDAYVIVNAMAKELMGADATVQARDLSSYISVGETLMQYGRTNVFNALGIVLGRSIIATRPYKGKFRIIEEDNAGMYGQIERKISFYDTDAVSTGWFNTDLNGANLKDGAENTSAGTLDAGANSATGSMWEQHQAKPVEVYFGGSDVWQHCITMYENQLAPAMRNPAEMATLATGILTEHANAIESRKEALRRATVINYIAGIYDLSANMPGSAVNLTATFNAEFGTSYTSAQLLTTHLEELLKHMVETIKVKSDLMTDRLSLHHWTPDANEILSRHTSKDRQKLFLLNPFIIKAQSWIYPSLFNEEYLSLENFEGVNYWQNPNVPGGIDIEPAIPDVSDPTEQTTGAEVKDITVLGVLFDRDALRINFQMESAYTTPLEARKGYRNTWLTIAKNPINDFSENGIIFYLEDPSEP